jgi:hypothetical protein
VALLRTLGTTLAILLAITFVTSAQENDAANKAYCKAQTETAMAQRDELLAPTASVGPGLPSVGTTPQVVTGLTNSFANDYKARLTMRAAKTDCSLYRANVAAQQKIVYALPQIEKEVLRHRLALIDAASDLLDAQIQSNMQLVSAGNLARPSVYYLQSAKIRLDSNRTAALTGIATPYVPPLDPSPLKDLISTKVESERNNEFAQTKLQKQNGWDIVIAGGTYHQLAQGINGINPSGGYGSVQFTYNLGRHAANKHLDKAAEAYVEWKKTQYDDVSHQAEILRKQMMETVAIQEEQLQTLLAHDADLTEQLTSLETVSTSSAISFRNELTSDRILLRVDIRDIQFRISLMHEYLRDNF